MPLNSFHAIKLLLLFVLLYGCQTPKTESQLPNIVVVLADDLGYGDLSVYAENNKIKTPHLDQMAKEGLRFTDAHTPAAVCTPTRYGFLTGRYNWRSTLKKGVLTGNSNALIPQDRTTIATLLNKKNYHTAFIGKWHLGWNWATKTGMVKRGDGWNPQDFEHIDFAKPIEQGPNSLGFDYSYGHSGSLDMAPFVYVENNLPTAIPTSSTVNKGRYSWWREGPTAPDFIHEEVTPNFFERSIKYIEARSKEENPFFLYLALPSPHTPILPTQPWQGKSGLNPYGDFTMMVDTYMGKLLQSLKDLGIEDNTLVLFTSDNGCSPAAKIDEMQAKGHFPSGPFRGHKADLYEGGHRVPFIVKWPAVIPKETVSHQTICLTDLLATFADITNYKLKENEGEDSYSLLQLLMQPTITKPLREATVHHSIEGNFAIRKGDWKLLLNAGSGGWSSPTPKEVKNNPALPQVQLYNLKEDPQEAHNVEADHPEKVAALQKLLSRYILEGRSTPGAAQKNDSIDFEWKQIEFVQTSFTNSF